jgi:hypothetical protein
MTTISDLKESMDLYIHNPAEMAHAALDVLVTTMKGENEQLDPTSPFIQLIEASVASASLGLDHQMISLSKRYPVLAETYEELHHHMCDDDLVGLYAEPAYCEFIFEITLSSLQQNVINHENNIYSYVTVPRDTTIEVEDLQYSLTHDIEIRIDNLSGAIMTVKLPNTTDLLKTHIVPSDVLRNNDGVNMLIFRIDGLQVERTLVEKRAYVSGALREVFKFNDNFVRVDAEIKDGADWGPLSYSFSDQTFDPDTPKIILSKHEDGLSGFMPPIYTEDGIRDGIRLLITSSKGKVDIDYIEMPKANFTTEVKRLGENLKETDIGFSRCSYSVFSDFHVSGGRDALSFSELKQRVIYNSVGVNQLPITPSTVRTEFENVGYSSVLHLDTLTGRTYTVSSPLPKADNLEMKTTPDVGFIKITGSISSISQLGHGRSNGQYVTILKDQLYKVDQLEIDFVPKSVSDTYLAMNNEQKVAAFNSAQYRYSPFFYVLEQKYEVMTCEIFQLDTPKIVYKDYKAENPTGEVQLNIIGGDVKYETDKYLLDIVIKPDGGQTLEIPDIFIQLSFIDLTTKIRVYIEPTMVTLSEDLFFVSFELRHNYNIIEDNIEILNAKHLASDFKVFIPLTSGFDVVYGLTKAPSGYKPTVIDDITYSPEFAPRYPVSHEVLQIHLGTNVKHLWRDIIPHGDDVIYRLVKQDVPMVYKEDVFNGDEEFILNADCSFDAVKLHSKGDPVLDEKGNQRYEYRAGDYILDEFGNYIIEDYNALTNDIDIFVCDGPYYVTDDEDLLKHLQWLYDYVVRRSTKDIEPLITRVLERTRLYFKPRDSLTVSKVNISRTEHTYINMRTHFEIIVYVEDNVYNNLGARKIITDVTFSTLDSNLSRSTVSHDTIINELAQVYDVGVISVSIEPSDDFGGLKSIKMGNLEHVLSLQKECFITQAGVLSVREDTNITFVNFTLK